MKKKLLFATAIASYLFSAQPALAQIENLDKGAFNKAAKSAQLFEIVEKNALQASTFDASMSVLSSDASTLSADQIRLNADMLDGSINEMYLPFGPGMVFPIKLSKSYWLNSGYQAWAGEVNMKNARKFKGKNTNRAVFVRNKNRVFGQINVDGRIFEIMTMENGKHMMVERDFSQLGVGDDTPDTELPVETSFTASNSLTSAALAPTTIRVLQVASTTALNRFGTNNVVDRMNFFIAQANDVYANNNIDIVLQDAGKFSSGRSELSSVSANIRGLQSPNDGYLDNFAGSVRDDRSADIVALITDNQGDRTCGQVNAIGGGQSNGFFVSRYTCTGFTFVHELGHLFGARHDNDPTRTPFAFGHGFVNAGRNFRTVMAVNSNPQPRIGFFSTDDQTFNGGALGNSTVADNERVHETRRATIGSFR
ncbi:M12 family metallo-peptidase [Agarilytica rhodophyticola]|uniref:M12 family metallo-peptidase n=1 Tax=Agarilytica rhodophyticola TaxID=1737490 RepID=UPI000B3451AA|nr:M12 family metallo-peptidase [Agarilytica rhodophyticola]